MSGSRLLGRFAAWEVRQVQRPGVPPVCMARSGGDARFVALYAPAPDRLRMQFYAEAWDFGEGGRVALSLRVDGGAPWAFGDARAFRQSVTFDLPQTKAGSAFLRAIMGGGTLRVADGQGRQVGRYGLGGSAAAVVALADCVRGP